MLKCFHYDDVHKIVSSKIYPFLRDDPVRPHIPIDDRFLDNKSVFCLEDNNEIVAVVCTAITDSVATSEDDLSGNSNGSVCMMYTLWSYKKGCGRKLVYELLDYVEAEMQHIQRVVTLSPKTDLARNFHLNNGAVELQINEDTVNFEYHLDNMSEVTA